ncbi:hypothetical protein IPF86_00550 [Candidatus Nomurabacteria bacterium]|jgi:hypothetical protein|nr:MAG: hypothetical protein IPF86_00550 [Candidatus Nomurabacteria bacterium]
MKNNLKLLTLAVVTLAYRLLTSLPYIPGNPIMAFQMPAGKLSKWHVFFFGACSVFLFNIIAPYIHHTLALDLGTNCMYSVLYGLIGMGIAYMYARKKIRRRKSYVSKLRFYLTFGIGGLVIFDIVTCTLMLFAPHAVTWQEIIMGQIVFTGINLLASTPFILLSPIIEKWFNIGWVEEQGMNFNTQPPLPRPERDGGGNIIWG